MNLELEINEGASAKEVTEILEEARGGSGGRQGGREGGEVLGEALAYFGKEMLGGGEACPAGEAVLVFAGGGDLVDWGEGVAAEAELEVAEEAVVLEEGLGLFAGEEACLGDGGEEAGGGGLAQCGDGVAMAAAKEGDLQFEVKEATGGVFEGAVGLVAGEFLGEAAAAEIGIFGGMLGGGAECGIVIEESGVFPGEGLEEVGRAGEGAGAGEEVAFPIHGLVAVVVAEAVEADGEGTILAVRAEAEIEPEAGAGEVAGEVLEGGGGFVGREGIGGEGKDIEIGTRGEFAGTEFAQGDEEEGAVGVEGLEEGAAGGFGEGGELGLEGGKGINFE